MKYFIKNINNFLSSILSSIFYVGIFFFLFHKIIFPLLQEINKEKISFINLRDKYLEQEEIYKKKEQQLLKIQREIEHLKQKEIYLKNFKPLESFKETKKKMDDKFLISNRNSILFLKR